MASKIFVDSDTLLDFLLDRSPFADYSQSLISKGLQGTMDLCTSTLILANVHYLVSKNINRHAAQIAIKEILTFAKILAFDEGHVKAALDSGHVDFEDTIQFYIAFTNQCDLIISRNIKHYKKFDIPVLTAEQFLRTIL
ncbi:type II toxin-antitoxin system VapC family toxin [Mucilaginibacter psychrotolerans]|uniref:PIN domain-containing protein n=1 Tax=Mucilaginibacter psychrotolerans TaxID=1524096 RepID=A0A4Y8SGS6_9SPHI|nr:PIN domain-containing protein [Mucilaginibacter psychrotolerans]TFF38273.1 PIN domain-containing protein [Mucilaginibacter psychrotolerans]